MTILLPVISHSVDQVILDYLSQIQYGDVASTIDGDLNHNNQNTIDENNNNQVDHGDIGEEVVGDWAAEPWTPRDDVDIPEWAKLMSLCYLMQGLSGPKVGDTVDVFEDLVWADDPWTQTPLIDIPAWMMLPGIDFDIPEAPTDNNDEQLFDAGDNDDDMLDSCVEIRNWSDEKFEQLPLDVPRWALLPGIDFPVRIRGRNSDYWEKNIYRHARVRGKFAFKVYERKLPTLLEERLASNYHGESILCVQTRFGRRF